MDGYLGQRVVAIRTPLLMSMLERVFVRRTLNQVDPV
jgi:hypothetical protein